MSLTSRTRARSRSSPSVLQIHASSVSMPASSVRRSAPPGRSNPMSGGACSTSTFSASSTDSARSSSPARERAPPPDRHHRLTRRAHHVPRRGRIRRDQARGRRRRRAGGAGAGRHQRVPHPSLPGARPHRHVGHGGGPGRGRIRCARRRRVRHVPRRPAGMDDGHQAADGGASPRPGSARPHAQSDVRRGRP